MAGLKRRLSIIPPIRDDPTAPVRYGQYREQIDPKKNRLKLINFIPVPTQTEFD